MESKWKDVSRCYIDSAAQPLNRAVMKPFKEALRNTQLQQTWQRWWLVVWGGLSTVMNRLGLKNKIVQYVHTALDDIRSNERVFQHAWSHLFVTSDELPNVLLRAHELKYGIVPELLLMQQSLITKMLKMSPRATGDMHNADAPDDEDVGERLQYWHKLRSKHRQLLHRKMLQAQAVAAQEETLAQKILQKLLYLPVAYGRYPP